MGHYASEMVADPTPEQAALIARAIKVEEEAKLIPLGEFLVGENPEVMRINASGLRTGPHSSEYDIKRIEWWEAKIEKWKKAQDRKQDGF